MADEAIKGRIRKLQALAAEGSGASDAERASAAAMAERLIKQHNVITTAAPRQPVRREPTGDPMAVDQPVTLKSGWRLRRSPHNSRVVLERDSGILGWETQFTFGRKLTINDLPAVARRVGLTPDEVRKKLSGGE
jgi:hypothetical protein